MNDNNGENKGYSDYGRIDLTKEDIEPIESSPVSTPEKYNDIYSEELPVAIEKIDLREENIPPVINNNHNHVNEEIEIKDYDAPGGISQVYIPETPERKLPKKIVVALTFICVLVLLLGIGFLYFINKPKQLFLKSVNDAYINFNETYYSQIVDDIDAVQNKAISRTNKVIFNLQTNEQMYFKTAELLNNTNAEFTIQNDFKNKKLAYDLNLNTNENSLSTSIFGTSNEIYVALKNIFPKYIKIDMDENTYNSMFSSSNVKEIEKSINKIKNIYLNELEDRDFSKVKEEIEIEGKTYKTKKVTLKLDNLRIKEINDNAVKKILDDKELISSLSRILNLKEKEVENKINNLIKISSIESDIYLYEKKPIKLTLKTNIESNENEIVVIHKKNYLDLTYKKDGYIEFSFTKQNNETFMNFENMTIEINENNENEYLFTIKKGLDKTEGSLKISKKEISNKEIINNLILSIKISPTTTLIINNETKIKTIDKVEIPNVTDSVNIDELKEEEIDMILEKILTDLNNILGEVEIF